MAHDAHDLEFTVLIMLALAAPAYTSRAQAHLEAFVLEHALDGGVLAAGRQLGLENDAEGAIAYDLALCVRQVLMSRLAGASHGDAAGCLPCSRPSGRPAPSRG